MKFANRERLFILTGLIGLFILLLITILHHQAPLFDEVIFLKNLYLFERLGFSREFLYTMDSAPGPLYELVHYPLRGLTGLTTPGIRLVNVFFLGGVIWLLARMLAVAGGISRSAAITGALAIMSVPVVWQIAGLALTEMPTLFFALLSVWALLSALRAEEARSVVKSSCIAFLAGLSAGLAIWGRSPFLVLLAAAFVLLAGHWREGGRWRIILLYISPALAMALPLFAIWHGLMAPRQAFVSAGGISIWHGLLAFAYGALFTLLIAPRWFYFNRGIGRALCLTYVLLLCLNTWGIKFEYSPLSEVVRKIVPASFMEIYPYLISPLLATLSLYFIGTSLYRAWQRRGEPFFLFMFACGMLILASTAKVTHLFSTRYVAQAAPFLVWVLYGYDRPTFFRWARLVAGIVIGFLSLETYFHFH